MRVPSEKPACPSRRTPSALKTESGRRQPERGGKGCWDAEHPDRDWPGGEAARIASQPLLKAETIPRALCARQDHVCDGWRSGGRWRQTHLKALMTHELDTSAPVCFAAPIVPEDWGRTHPQRMRASHSPGAALRWRGPATGIARAASRNGNCECWLHTPGASSHRLLGEAIAGAASVWLDTAAFHQAGEQNPGRRSGQLSRARRCEGKHSQKGEVRVAEEVE